MEGKRDGGVEEGKEEEREREISVMPGVVWAHLYLEPGRTMHG